MTGRVLARNCDGILRIIGYSIMQDIPPNIGLSLLDLFDNLLLIKPYRKSSMSLAGASFS